MSATLITSFRSSGVQVIVLAVGKTIVVQIKSEASNKNHSFHLRINIDTDYILIFVFDVLVVFITMYCFLSVYL